MPKIIDLVGQKFGDLTVLTYAGLNTNKRPKHQWLCRCSCGVEVLILGESLRNGHTKTCGCKQGRWKHGHCKTVSNPVDSPTYMSWVAMRNRCLDHKHNAFERYGAKGISVCDAWAKSFESFLSDMGERPSNCTLDRKDNNQGYSKDNCRWATTQQQYENKRVVRDSAGKFTKE